MSSRKQPGIAREAIVKMLVPIANFAIQSGIGARELQSLLRTAAVTEAARLQSTQYLRVNVARISASTGIPRAEISRILREKDAVDLAFGPAKPHSINRILTEWTSNPSFTTKRGRPLELKIFGEGHTFEFLVRSNGAGLPVRAVLDELVRLGSVIVVGEDRIKLVFSVAGTRGYSPREMRSLTDHAVQLLESIFQKMLTAEPELLMAEIEGEVSDNASLPLFRKQVVSDGEDLLSGLRESLFRTKQVKKRASNGQVRHRVRVSVVYQEVPIADLSSTALKGRKNFRRVTAS